MTPNPEQLRDLELRERAGETGVLVKLGAEFPGQNLRLGPGPGVRPTEERHPRPARRIERGEGLGLAGEGEGADLTRDDPGGTANHSDQVRRARPNRVDVEFNPLGIA